MSTNKLLVIDDDEDILTLVKMFLTMNNYTVEALARWEYVDEYISKFGPELILLDISLKGADGRDICKKLKQNELTRHIPVILFSANTELGNNFKAYNAEGFVEKPFELPHLLKTIQFHLEDDEHISRKN